MPLLMYSSLPHTLSMNGRKGLYIHLMWLQCNEWGLQVVNLLCAELYRSLPFRIHLPLKITNELWGICVYSAYIAHGVLNIGKCSNIHTFRFGCALTTSICEGSSVSIPNTKCKHWIATKKVKHIITSSSGHSSTQSYVLTQYGNYDT